MLQRLSSQLFANYVAPEGVDIELPNYDRTKLKAGIVHFGPGNFSLAHLADKTHDLMQSGDVEALNYGIVGVSTQKSDRRDQLAPQDGLYTVAEQDPDDKNKLKVVGSVIGVLFAPEDPQAVIDQIALPDTRIISMTITPQIHEKYMNADGSLNLDHQDIINDLDPANAPVTIYGYIARGIQQREKLGLPGLSIMNLDNMEHNGDKLARMVGDFASAFDPSLIEAIKDKISFPNSMVDRIVPKTTQELIETVSQRAGFMDAAIVPAEPMPKIGSWVVEDKFINGRPAWESQGLVQIVPDVLPYEKMKLRLLNVSHAAIANLGDLAGYAFIDETMGQDAFQEMMRTLMNNETEPTLLPVPGIDLAAYKDELVARFVNPAIKDTTWRVSKDAPLQVVLDSARDQLESGGSIEILALTTAAWMLRFRADVDEKGGKIDAVHPMVTILKAKATEGGNDPAAMFTITEVFGTMGQNPDFVQAVASYLEQLTATGVTKTIESAIAVSDIYANKHRPGTPMLSASGVVPGPGGNGTTA